MFGIFSQKFGMYISICGEVLICLYCFFFFSSRRRHTRYWRDWSSDVCSSDLYSKGAAVRGRRVRAAHPDGGTGGRDASLRLRRQGGAGGVRLVDGGEQDRTEAGSSDPVGALATGDRRGHRA